MAVRAVRSPLVGAGGRIGLPVPPAGYFLLAQKVTKDAHETDGFVTSFPAGKRDFR